MTLGCPYGGYCIDPGNPTDCSANKKCVNFSSVEDKTEFDNQPDKYYFQFQQGGIIKFKNENQLTFFLTDLPEGTKKAGQWGKI